jgi:hypothetical protein
VRYVYEGPAPYVDGGGQLVHPGDVQEYDAAPLGPWRELADSDPLQPPESAVAPPGPPPGLVSAPDAGGPAPADVPPLAATGTEG